MQSLRSWVLVTPQRPLPCLLVVDQWSRVTQLIRQFSRGVMYIGSKNSAKLGDKRADVIPSWVGLFTLGVGIKDAKVWLRVRASACAPLPTTIVRSEIAVYKLLHKML